MKKLWLLLYLMASTAEAAPTASFTVRTTGYASTESAGTAPLGVLFDATATTSPLTTQPFHDLLYVWDFGETATLPAWLYGTGNRNKNVAIGPIAGHLYKTPGVYTVTLTVTDEAGVQDVKNATVTVVSPDNITMANTYCYSNGVSFLGCVLDSAADGDTVPNNGVCNGTNQTHCVTTSLIADMLTRLGTGRRHQFRKGDVFTKATIASLTGSGVIEGFGTASTRFEMDVPGSVFGFNGTSGYTLKDLKVSPGVVRIGGAAHANATSNGTSNLTLYNIHATNGAGLVNLSDRVHSDIFVQENTGDSVGVQPEGFVFAQCDGCAFLGNSFDAGDPIAAPLENNVRFQHIRKTVFSNNRVRGSTDQKVMITLRACVGTEANCTEGLTYSEFNVISDNELYANEFVGMPAISLHEQNRPNATMFDFIIENNYIACAVATCQGVNSSVAGRSGADADGVRVTVRNNILNLLNFVASNSSAVVVTGSSLTYVANDWRIYHNTIYEDNGAGGIISIAKMYGGTHILRNNLMYAPVKTTKNVGLTDGSATFTASTNFRDGNEYVGDPFVTATGPKDTANEFELALGAGPVDAGTAFTGGAPWVYLDAFLHCRPHGTGWDVGAHERAGDFACLNMPARRPGKKRWWHVTH